MPRSPNDPVYRKLRALLAGARLEAGLTQTELAKKLRRPQSFVSKYESGERNIDVVEFIAICKALRLVPSAVLDLI